VHVFVRLRRCARRLFILASRAAASRQRNMHRALVNPMCMLLCACGAPGEGESANAAPQALHSQTLPHWRTAQR